MVTARRRVVLAVDMGALARDLDYLHSQGALAGVAAIIAARAARHRHRLDAGYLPGRIPAAAAAEITGPRPDPQAYAQGGALLAAEIDRLGQERPR